MGFFTNWIGRLVDLKLDQRGFNDQFLDPLSFDERYRLVEHEVQFKAETSELIYFYKTKRPTNEHYSTHLFWRDVSGKLPVQHFPLARIITKAKTNLVFHDSPTFSVLTKTGKADKKDQKVLDACFKENKIINVLRSASDMKSYSGGVAIVPVMDNSVSDHVIWKAYPRERCHPNKEYNRVTSVVVYDEYVDGDGKAKRKFVLCSEYGKGYVSYKLLDESNPAKPRPCGMNECYETAGKTDLMFLENGAPSKQPLFVYVENDVDGMSDYQNLIDDFSSLDESYSALTDFVRKAHIKTYVPKSQAIKNPQTGESYAPDDFSENVSFIPMANPTNAPYKIERDTIPMTENISSLVTAFNETLAHALLTTGLSPATIGISTGGANESSLALNIRERVSMRTRADSIGMWAEALCDLMTITLKWELGSGVASQDPDMPIASNLIDLSSFAGQCSVTFPEYESPSFDQKVLSLQAALNAGLIDRETALRQLWPDLNDDQIQVMLIAIQGGMPLSEAEIEMEEEKKHPEEVKESEDDESEDKEDESGDESEDKGDPKESD